MWQHNTKLWGRSDGDALKRLEHHDSRFPSKNLREVIENKPAFGGLDYLTKRKM